MMSSQDENGMLIDDIVSQSTSVSVTTLPDETSSNKKRKIDEMEKPMNSQNNIAKFKVLKKLIIQLTRTRHHIEYLEKSEQSKSIPKPLRVNLTPQVPVINSTLSLKWEEAHLNFGHSLTKILLE